MGKDQDPNKDEVQREILAQKKFSLASAISRAESGLMKGESPLSQQEQAIIELTHWIGQQVSDPLGALKSILRCQVRGNRPLVVNQLQHPHKALQEIIETILSNDYALKEFVVSAARSDLVTRKAPERRVTNADKSSIFQIFTLILPQKKSPTDEQSGFLFY
jgi:hypothetical protein